jgi:arsenate reductase-like glutaredoxin family protein
MKRKKTSQEKHFTYVQILNYKKTGMKNADIARLLNISSAKITRIVNDDYYKEIQALDNLKISDMSLEMSRSLFSLQTDIIRMARVLEEKTMEGADQEELDRLIKSLNCLCRFCQYSFNHEVK